MTQQAFVVAGMAYGDEGKGATVDYLVRRHGATQVVRYNGGHQAAHNVVLSDGRHHTFAQFGSGSFVLGVKTHLSRFMLVNPAAQMVEEEHLCELGVTDLWERTTVHEDCVVVTPIHRAANRLLEMARGEKRHGSCGVGVGVARGDALNYPDLALRAGDLRNPDVMRRKLRFSQKLREHIFSYEPESYARIPDRQAAEEEMRWLHDPSRIDEIISHFEKWPARVVSSFEPDEVTVFEGAQGILLDETHGTAPHNTWTNTTFDNALALLQEARWKGEITKIGCFRTYFTRHGAGPFPTEGKGLGPYPPEAHNASGRYQGAWRTGSFDFDLARHAIKVCGGIDAIALSHCDAFPFFFERIERELKVPVTIRAWGPTYEDREEVPPHTVSESGDAEWEFA